MSVFFCYINKKKKKKYKLFHNTGYPNPSCICSNPYLIIPFYILTCHTCPGFLEVHTTIISSYLIIETYFFLSLDCGRNSDESSNLGEEETPNTNDTTKKRAGRGRSSSMVEESTASSSLIRENLPSDIRMGDMRGPSSFTGSLRTYFLQHWQIFVTPNIIEETARLEAMLNMTDSNAITDENRPILYILARVTIDQVPVAKYYHIMMGKEMGRYNSLSEFNHIQTLFGESHCTVARREFLKYFYSHNLNIYNYIPTDIEKICVAAFADIVIEKQWKILYHITSTPRFRGTFPKKWSMVDMPLLINAFVTNLELTTDSVFLCIPKYLPIDFYSFLEDKTEEKRKQEIIYTINMFICAKKPEFDFKLNGSKSIWDTYYCMALKTSETPFTRGNTYITLERFFKTISNYEFNLSLLFGKFKQCGFSMAKVFEAFILFHTGGYIPVMEFIDDKKTWKVICNKLIIAILKYIHEKMEESPELNDDDRIPLTRQQRKDHQKTTFLMDETPINNLIKILEYHNTEVSTGFIDWGNVVDEYATIYSQSRINPNRFKTFVNELHKHMEHYIPRDDMLRKFNCEEEEEKEEESDESDQPIRRGTKRALSNSNETKEPKRKKLKRD